MHATTAVSRRAHSITLPGGTRTVAIQDREARNVSLVIALPVGMRHERQGEEGMMHLIEHMVFQDSIGISASKRELNLNAAGSVIGGHTHMDYTEFYETALPGQLQKMTARMLDQIFRPAFNPAQITSQIAAVAKERANRLELAPGNVLPFPHVTSSFWEDQSHGHDGTGDSSLHGRATSEVLRRLHSRHYNPAEAVMVAFGPDEPENMLKIMEHELATLPQSVIPERMISTASLRASSRTEIRSSRIQAPRLIAATQLARANTVNEELIGDYLVASLLSLQPALDASAGIFGPADLAENDLFIFVDDSGLGVTPASRLHALFGAEDNAITAAGRRALYAAERSARDDERMVRSTARDLLLRNSPAFSPTLVDYLARLQNNTATLRKLIAQSTQRLADQQWQELIITPRSDEEA